MAQHAIEQALESIAGWDVWGALEDGLGDASTYSCPNCGFTGTMDPPTGLIPPPPKKLAQSMAAAQFYDSYSDLRDALSEVIADQVKYAYVVDFGEDWVIYSGGDTGEAYYRSVYNVGPSGQISLNDKVEVHRVFVPVAQ